MTGAAAEPRRAASPYARRLARDGGIALRDIAGSGPGGRIVAADILSLRAPEPGELPASREAPEAANLPERPAPAPASFALSAALSLEALFKLAEEGARVGLTVEVEDAALRALRTAIAAAEGLGEARIALEAERGQILVSSPAGLSIGAERRQRLDALEAGADVSGQPATASLLVLRASRVVPVSMPLRPDRRLRLVLMVDGEAETASVLLSADAATVSERQALTLLDAFVVALEQPLALLA